MLADFLAHLLAHLTPVFRRYFLPAPGRWRIHVAMMVPFLPLFAHLLAQLAALLGREVAPAHLCVRQRAGQQHQHQATTGKTRENGDGRHDDQEKTATDVLSPPAERNADAIVRECFHLPTSKHLLPFACVVTCPSQINRFILARMNDTHQHILVVDDDARLRDLLTRYLTEQGFEVKAVADGQQMDKARAREHYHLIVLDLMMPGEDGLSICRRLRGQGDTTPVIMLTAKGDEVDRIVGLEMGADDYLPKPFNPRELLARMHAVLRRQGSRPPGAPDDAQECIRFSNIEVDLAARTLKRGDEIVSLTTGEFAVLKVLLQHPRQPLSRDKLMTLARGREQGPFDRAIDVQVSRLRKLIEPDPAQPRYLQTVWGFGYVFVPDGSTRD